MVPQVVLERTYKDLRDRAPEMRSMRRDAVEREGFRIEIEILSCLRVIRTGSSLRKMDDKLRMRVEIVWYYFTKILVEIMES